MGLQFRAWAKGDLPDTRLSRLYLPQRFSLLSDSRIIKLIHLYNPKIRDGTLEPKHTESAKGGKALFIEIDMDSYAFIREKGYRIEFLQSDLECTGVTIKTKKRRTLLQTLKEPSEAGQEQSHD